MELSGGPVPGEVELLDEPEPGGVESELLLGGEPSEVLLVELVVLVLDVLELGGGPDDCPTKRPRE